MYTHVINPKVWKAKPFKSLGTCQPFTSNSLKSFQVLSLVQGEKAPLLTLRPGIQFGD